MLAAYLVHYGVTAFLLPIAPFGFVVTNKSKNTV